MATYNLERIANAVAILIGQANAVAVVAFHNVVARTIVRVGRFIVVACRGIHTSVVDAAAIIVLSIHVVVIRIFIGTATCIAHATFGFTFGRVNTWSVKGERLEDFILAVAFREDLGVHDT